MPVCARGVFSLRMQPRKAGSASLNAPVTSGDEEEAFGGDISTSYSFGRASGKPSDKRSYYSELEAEVRGEVPNSRKKLVLGVLCVLALVWISLVGLVRVFGWGSDAESPAVAPPSDATAYYYKHWCNNTDLHGSGMQFLDDTLCQKKFPRNSDRDLTCEGIPTQLQDMPPGYTDVTTLADLQNLPNVTLLTGPDVDVFGLSIGVVVIRRTPDGRTFFKQYGNSISSTPVETWSSSKLFVAAAAGVRLHDETDCADFGLHSYVSSIKHHEVPLGDLATIIASYDVTAGYTSNSLAYYFRGIAQGKRLQQVLDSGSCLFSLCSRFVRLIAFCAVVPNSSSTLSGSYGEPMTQDFGLDSSTFSGENAGAIMSGVALPDTCTLSIDHSPVVSNNSLSSIASAQLLLRLVLHRELPLTARYPLLQWSDIQDLLYGAGERSRLFPGVLWGGMSADTGLPLSISANPDIALRLTSVLQQFFFRNRCRRWILSMPPVMANGAYSASLVMAIARRAM